MAPISWLVVPEDRPQDESARSGSLAAVREDREQGCRDDRDRGTDVAVLQ